MAQTTQFTSLRFDAATVHTVLRTWSACGGVVSEVEISSCEFEHFRQQFSMLKAADVDSLRLICLTALNPGFSRFQEFFLPQSVAEFILEFCDVSGGDLAAIIGNGDTSSLRALSVCFDRHGDELANVVARRLDVLRSLVMLRLRGVKLSDVGLCAMIENNLLARVSDLDVSQNPLTDSGILCVFQESAALRSLNVGFTGITSKTLENALHWPLVLQLEHLVLAGTCQDGGIQKPLEEIISRGLLKSVDVTGCPMSDDAKRSLAHVAQANWCEIDFFKLPGT